MPKPHCLPLFIAQNLPSRPRRNRRSETFRSGIRENWLSPAHFILPIFVHEGDRNEPIASMPGINRLAYGKNVVDHVAEARSLGVNQVVIFPKVTLTAVCCCLQTCKLCRVLVMLRVANCGSRSSSGCQPGRHLPQGDIAAVAAIVWQ
jgi:hypothetical protein